MDRYQRVPVAREPEDHAENEVRITSQGKSRSYISYGTSLLSEKGHSSVVLKAMGKAINKTVTIAEIMKRRIAGLHQHTAISSVRLTDRWEPREEGLDAIETTRHVSVIAITLSKEPLDTSAPGYQPPLPESEVRPLQDEEHLAGEADAEGEEGGSGFRRGRGGRGGRGRGRGRGPPRSGDAAAEGAAPEGFEGGGGRGRGRGGRGGRGRGRGRGGRGRGRGAEGAPAEGGAAPAVPAPAPLPAGDAAAE